MNPFPDHLYWRQQLALQDTEILLRGASRWDRSLDRRIHRDLERSGSAHGVFSEAERIEKKRNGKSNLTSVSILLECSGSCLSTSTDLSLFSLEGSDMVTGLRSLGRVDTGNGGGVVFII
jgi:hypothetical protein